MAILPGKEAENARYLYPTIKRWGNTKGVPTQCINGLKMAPPFGKGGGKGGKGGGKGGGRGPKVLGTDGSYSAGILLKARPRCPLASTLSHASPLAPPPSIQPPRFHTQPRLSSGAAAFDSTTATSRAPPGQPQARRRERRLKGDESEQIGGEREADDGRRPRREPRRPRQHR